MQHKLKDAPAKWELNESNLSEDDKSIIEYLGFPKKVGMRECVQVRVSRMRANNGFVDKQVIGLEDIKYLIVPKSVAKQQIARYSINSNNPEEVRFLENVTRAKAYKHIYIDANYIEEHLATILSKYSTPKPTPSMVEATEKPEPKKAEKKGLAPAHKAKAKKMYQKENKDAAEIAEELGKDKDVVIEYLKTL